MVLFSAGAVAVLCSLEPREERHMSLIVGSEAKTLANRKTVTRSTLRFAFPREPLLDSMVDPPKKRGGLPLVCHYATDQVYLSDQSPPSLSIITLQRPEHLFLLPLYSSPFTLHNSGASRNTPYRRRRNPLPSCPLDVMLLSTHDCERPRRRTFSAFIDGISPTQTENQQAAWIPPEARRIPWSCDDYHQNQLCPRH